VTRSRAGAPLIVRGRIYGAVLGDGGEKYYLAVSNNQRNRTLDSFLGVRLTTTRKPALDTVVGMEAADDPWVGSMLTDCMTVVYRDEVTRDLGALRLTTMKKIDVALRVALALR
jgi:mRNA-degrading endonuclease toxin of MazEF toxin-antitoxin module